MSMRKDKGTNKGNSNHASATQAQMLVKALTDFILPMIGNIQNPEEENLHESNRFLAPEAQALVKALESFVTAVARPCLNLDDTTKALADQAPEARPNAGLKPDDNPPSQTSKSDHLYYTNSAYLFSLAPSESPLLKFILEEARHRLFNKMPIRLLAFQKDGSGIELVERGVLWQRISAAIEANFNEEEMQSKIQDDADEYNKIFAEEPRDFAFTGAIGAFISQHTRYAILSHTWLHDLPGEVTYANWNDGELVQGSPGYQKLIGFCKIAAKNHNVTLGWMDTICIDKASSSELDESIRSMYKWYSDATICIVYLARTSALNEMRYDPWFTRGWTLQELLTRSPIQFYDASWKKLGHEFTDDEIVKEITAATTITHSEILNFRPSLTNISRRMQWAAHRQVTREEDAAYSLMGIFDVSISIAYGEGAERAFIRLIKEILDSSDGDVLDVINWGSGPDRLPSTTKHSSFLIPSSPKQYLFSSKKEFVWPRLVAPITLTHLGLRLPVLLMPAVDSKIASLPIGDYHAAIRLSIETITRMSIDHRNFNVLAKRKDFSYHYPSLAQSHVMGVLNFTENEAAIELSPSLTCFAVILYFPSGLSQPGTFMRLLTTIPVVFDLQRVTEAGSNSVSPSSRSATDHIIPKTELAKHGLSLRTMYL